MEIIDRLQEIFRDVFDDVTILLTKDITANDIEDWDSLAQINLIMAIEKDFKIEFTLNDVSGLKNVGEMLEVIKRKIG